MVVVLAPPCGGRRNLTTSRRCLLRSLLARLRGQKWDGHCWDGVEFEPAVYCLDCGKVERID